MFFLYDYNAFIVKYGHYLLSLCLITGDQDGKRTTQKDYLLPVSQDDRRESWPL
jgi:hypothetical protein